MAESMETNLQGDAGKVRELTPKQQVKALYPDSAAFFNGKQWEIWAEDGISLRKFGTPNTNNIRGNSARRAWAHAWLRIQKRMIRKLEQ